MVRTSIPRPVISMTPFTSTLLPVNISDDSSDTDSCHLSVDSSLFEPITPQVPAVQPAPETQRAKCLAINRYGVRCKRNQKQGNYCWLHGKRQNVQPSENVLPPVMLPSGFKMASPITLQEHYILSPRLPSLTVFNEAKAEQPFLPFPVEASVFGDEMDFVKQYYDYETRTSLVKKIVTLELPAMVAKLEKDYDNFLIDRRTGFDQFWTRLHSTRYSSSLEEAVDLIKKVANEYELPAGEHLIPQKTMAENYAKFINDDGALKRINAIVLY